MPFSRLPAGSRPGIPDVVKTVITLVTLGMPIAPWAEEALRPSAWVMRSSDQATPVYLQASGRPGPVTLVVGGIHGDEIAGMTAAQQLAKTKPGRGKLVIIPVANRPAAESGVRTAYFMQDLNRAFPGNPNGSETERLAASIMKAIARYRPDVIVDLHETGAESDPDWEEKKNTLILSPGNRAAEIALGVLESLPASPGEKPFSFLSGAPQGSLNREAARRFGIPVITIETSRRDALADRVGRHIDIVMRIHAATGGRAR